MSDARNFLFRWKNIFYLTEELSKSLEIFRLLNKWAEEPLTILTTFSVNHDCLFKHFKDLDALDMVFLKTQANGTTLDTEKCTACTGNATRKWLTIVH